MERLGSVGPGVGRRKPRPVAIPLSNVDDTKNIMRSKRNLKDSERYSRVNIEPDRPADIRALEASMRCLTRELPNVEYRRGRVVGRTQEGGETRGPAAAPAQQPDQS